MQQCILHILIGFEYSDKEIPEVDYELVLTAMVCHYVCDQ